MARVAFENKPAGISRTIDSIDYPVIRIDDENYKSKFTNKTFTSKNIKATSYPVSKFDNLTHSVKLDSILPFRIKFTTIGVKGADAFTVPPIGIAIIGISNYIL
jgi:hypothetical protein